MRCSADATGAGGYRRRSSAASSNSAGSGQLSPAARSRSRHRWTVLRLTLQIEAIWPGTRCDSKWRRRILRDFLIGNRLSGNMFSFAFRKTSAEDYQRRSANPARTHRYAPCGHPLRCLWAAVPFHVGTDYAMWALITVKPGILPTSQRNRCPHQSVFSAHIHWNQLPTWTGIRRHRSQE